jgi:hypothetical protein
VVNFVHGGNNYGFNKTQPIAHVRAVRGGL